MYLWSLLTIDCHNLGWRLYLFVCVEGGELWELRLICTTSTVQDYVVHHQPALRTINLHQGAQEDPGVEITNKISLSFGKV